MVGKDLFQRCRSERFQAKDASRTAEQRLLAVFKDFVHERMYRAADEQVHPAVVLVKVPIMLHLAKN